MKVQVPTSLDAITVAQYKHLRTLDEIEDPLEQLRKKITYLCGITESQLDQLTEESFTQLVNAIAKIGANIKERYPLETFVDIDGVQYGFNPDLSRITLGEFADIEHLCQDGAEQNLESILSILYRPVTKKRGDFYQVAPYTGTDGKKFLGVPITVAFGAFAFFLTTAKELRRNFPNCSKAGAERL